MSSPGDKKGQRRGLCGHIMASFDLHKRCAFFFFFTRLQDYYKDKKSEHQKHITYCTSKSKLKKKKKTILKHIFK